MQFKVGSRYVTQDVHLVNNNGKAIFMISMNELISNLINPLIIFNKYLFFQKCYKYLNVSIDFHIIFSIYMIITYAESLRNRLVHTNYVDDLRNSARNCLLT